MIPTKLMRPPLVTSLVVRPELLAQFQRPYRRVTTVVAPPGYGKTTVVNALVAGEVVWLTVDDYDNDWRRFMAHWLQFIHLEEYIPFVLNGERISPEWLLSIVVEQLMVREWTMIMDDAHRLHNAVIWQWLNELIAHLPPGNELLFISRHTLLLQLGQWQLRGEVTMVTIEHLRWTDDAVRTYFAERQLTVTDEAIDRLDGWAASVQLAALIWKERQMISWPALSTQLQPFFLEQLYEQQSSQLQQFMLVTARFERFSEALCAAVIGDASLLPRLMAAQWLIQPLDEEGQFYRYHPLFREFLLRLPLDDEVDYKRRAAEWWCGQDDVIAFTLAMEAGDETLCTTIAIGDRMPLLFRGGMDVVSHWLMAKPEPLPQPLALMAASSAIYNGNVQEAKDRLVRLPSSPHTAALRAMVAVIEHDCATMMTEGEQAIASTIPPFVATGYFAVGYAHQVRGEVAAAQVAYRRARSLAERLNHFAILLMTAIGDVHLLEQQQEWQEAEREALAITRWPWHDAYSVAGDLYLALARFALRRGDVTLTEERLVRAEVLLRQIDATDRAVVLQLHWGEWALYKGDEVRAQKALHKAEQYGVLYPHRLEEISLLRRKMTAMLTEPLTKRERELLQLIAEGKSNQDIAATLFLAVTTVKGYNKQLFAKLGVANRTEAVAKARQLNLLK